MKNKFKINEEVIIKCREYNGIGTIKQIINKNTYYCIHNNGFSYVSDINLLKATPLARVLYE